MSQQFVILFKEVPFEIKHEKPDQLKALILHVSNFTKIKKLRSASQRNYLKCKCDWSITLIGEFLCNFRPG